MFYFSLDDKTELRLLEERHTEELFALTDQNRAHLRQWLPWVDGTTSLEDTRKFIRFSLEQFARNEGFNAGIWYHGKLAGVIGHHKIDWANRKTSIGYWLGASFQGQGLMTKSCRAVVDYNLNELKLNRVEIRCAVENRKSRAIPERLGFTQEGVIRQAERLYDHFVDHVVYGMLASEWRKS
ncbi:GNAT family N-acetyltransferase [Candidatus Acetothermia bacterium]|jgi:ribosomal-protein-serine acetyltransferase|nr:GNAT family N-acetyltransferase [Candidatus Acetothermia bacterium]MCI2431380.1 GNAT family N-acetyltransferase [Candidatus Acetothermia bacterium]MCI2435828.1 GNAT family N-acetyltransferase [Candidatus Acetothermia bacterium]